MDTQRGAGGVTAGVGCPGGNGDLAKRKRRYLAVAAPPIIHEIGERLVRSVFQLSNSTAQIQITDLKHFPRCILRSAPLRLTQLVFCGS